MGDGADQALERAAEECELFDKLQDASIVEQYEAGIIDEFGSFIGNPGTTSLPPKDLWDM